MKYTPESICSVLSGIVDVGDCGYMTKCESGMSSLIGNVWKFTNGRWIELERLDWPLDMTKDPYKHKIRWGSIGKNAIQINVHNSKINGIYKYDGVKLVELMIKPNA